MKKPKKRNSVGKDLWTNPLYKPKKEPSGKKYKRKDKHQKVVDTDANKQ